MQPQGMPPADDLRAQYVDLPRIEREHRRTNLEVVCSARQQVCSAFKSMTREGGLSRHDAIFLINRFLEECHYKTCSVLDSYMRSMNHGNREGTAGSDSSASEGDDEEEKVLEDPEIPKKSAMLPGARDRGARTEGTGSGQGKNTMQGGRPIPVVDEGAGNLEQRKTRRRSDIFGPVDATSKEVETLKQAIASPRPGKKAKH